MITPDQLRYAVEKQGARGYPAFTKSQVTDRVIEEDSFLGKKIQRAMGLGVTREQALNFYAYGSAHGKLPEPKKGNFFQRIAEDIKTRSANVGASLERQEAGEQGMGSTALQIAGEATGLAFGDVAGEALESAVDATPDSIKAPFKQMGIEILQTDLGQAGIRAISQGMEAYEEWKAQNPAVAENLESVVNIASALPVGAIAGKGLQAAKGGAKKAVQGAKTIKQAVKPMKTADDLLMEVDDVVGQIVQGDKEGIKQARKALSLLDTEGINTYEDLSGAIQTKISALSKKQDEILAKVTDRKSIDAFTKVAKAGKRSAESNPVRTAIDHLEELYQKTGQPEDLVRIQSLRDVARKEGLTPQQVNAIAREYGVEFKQKAFSKMGDPLTSVNAQLHENTRKAVKNSARDLLPDDTSKMLDEEMSSLFGTRDMVKKVADQAQKLTNKIERRNLFQKVAAAVGGGIDKLTGRSLSSFVTSALVRGNVGMKQLNSLQIQEKLGKNLKKLDKLMNKIDSLTDDEAVEGITNLLSE